MNNLEPEEKSEEKRQQLKTGRKSGMDAVSCKKMQTLGGWQEMAPTTK